jgi:hypothetical protein
MMGYLNNALLKITDGIANCNPLVASGPAPEHKNKLKKSHFINVNKKKIKGVFNFLVSLVGRPESLELRRKNSTGRKFSQAVSPKLFPVGC